MASLRFRSPITERNPTNIQLGYPLAEYSRRNQQIRDLMLATDRVNSCLALDQLANVRMLGDPEERKANGTTDCYLANSCNEYLSVVRLPAHASKHWIGVAPRALLVGSDWLIFGRPLTVAEVDGALPDEDPTLFAAPYWVPPPPNREWIEGPASNPDILERLSDQYGPDV